jgi:hypothetical protein
LDLIERNEAKLAVLELWIAEEIFRSAQFVGIRFANSVRIRASFEDFRLREEVSPFSAVSVPLHLVLDATV